MGKYFKNFIEEKMCIHVWNVKNFFKNGIMSVFFILLTIGLAFCEQTLKYTIKFLVDDKNNIHNILEIFIVIIFFYSILKIIAEYLKNTISENVVNSISIRMLEKLYSMDIQFFENSPKGEILSVFTTGRQELKKIYERFYPNLLSNYAAIFIGIIFLGFINKKFIVSLLIIYAPFAIILVYKEKEIQNRIYKHVIEKIHLDKKIYDAVTSVTEIRFNGEPNWMFENIKKQYSKFKKYRLKTVRTRYDRGVFYRVISLCEVIANGLIAYYLYNLGRISLGDFAVAIVIIIDITFLLNGILYLNTEQDKSIDYIKTIKIYLETEVKNIHKGNKAIDDITISLKNITHTYNNKLILKNISLTIPPKEKIVFVGETGSGKSTIAKIIAGFVLPTEGEYTIGGVNFKQCNTSQLRKKVAYMFQETQLWNTSFVNNICFGKNYTEEEIIEAAKMTGLHNIIVRTKDGYNTLIGENGISLSGGERQRLALTRIILKKPEIIILDEAFCSLDTENEETLRNVFLKMNDKTIICIEHNLKQINIFDNIVVLKDGEIAEYGEYEELIMKKGLLYEMVKNNENSKIVN